MKFNEKFRETRIGPDYGNNNEKKMLMILKNFTSAFDSVLTIVKTKLKSFHCKIKYLLQKAKLSNFISTLLDLTESPGSHCFLFNR